MMTDLMHQHMAHDMIERFALFGTIFENRPPVEKDHRRRGDLKGPFARRGLDVLSSLRAPVFTLELAGVGKFGSKLPRALWAGVRSNADLSHLQKKIEAAVQRLGHPAEERKFTPHVTLARLRNAPSEKVMDFVSHNNLFASGAFEMKSIALFSSLLGSARSYRAPCPGA